MISKALILKMGEMLGMDKAALKTAVDAEAETDFDIPTDIEVLTKDGLNRIRTESKAAGVEIAVKEYKRANNLKFDGKSVDDLATHLQSLNDVDGKVTALQTSLAEADRKAAAAEQRANEIEMRTDLHAAIPSEYNGLNKKELTAIAEANGYTFKRDDKGVLRAYLNGVEQRNARTQEALPASDVLKNFFEVDRKMKAGDDAGDEEKKGRGAKKDDVTPPTGFKRSEIQAAWEAANPGGNLNGMDYNSHFASKMREATEAGQAIEMD